MKKFVFALAAMFVMTTAAMAQNDDQQNNGGKKFDKTEMIQKRTDKMVETYGLDKKQAKLLLQLNTEYADKMRPMGGRGGQFRGGQRPQKPEGNDSIKKNRPGKEQMEARMKEMKANRDAYENELQKIMTSEQYAKYQEQSKKMMQRGPRDGQPGGNADEK